jgi:hypothetical protein
LGLPYFFSMDGKYEAGPVTLVVGVVGAVGDVFFMGSIYSGTPVRRLRPDTRSLESRGAAR